MRWLHMIARPVTWTCTIRMRWLHMVLFIAAIAIAVAEPEPKKYKPEVKTKDESTSLTKDEKKFLREVETKFGIKSDVPLDKKPEEENKNEEVLPEGQIKAPFPAVIAIEIVNDTDDKDTPSKGKRTIDANLGYGYQTNNGYTYTSFGQSQNKPKLMYYPYSQEDIPPLNTNAHSSGYTYNTPGSNAHSGQAVELMPSQAYELLETKEEQPNAYNYEKPSVGFKTEDNIQSVEQPPPSYQTMEPYRQAAPQTFYTTYNGQQFSGLSGQFPSVMSNYLVDSSQLLKSSQYQSAGLTRAHFQHGAQQEQKVVPVLVLRVPSSYLKKPTAELYANAPHSVSQYLNVNLQELVNQYFRKLGFHNAPQVMAYQNSHAEEVAAPAASYEPHKYASPYMQPTYTHAEQAGVQYSAVQPVMARYPAGHTRQQYYVNQDQQYQQPQQKYVYRYMYETPEHTQAYQNQAQYSQAHQQQSPEQTQAYYEQAQAYQQAQQLAAHTAQQAEVAAQQAQVAAQQAYSQQQHSADQETSHEAGHGNADAAYSQQQETSQEEEPTSVVYEQLNGHGAESSAQGYGQSTPNYESQTVTPQYETQTEPAAEYGSTRSPPNHDDTQAQQVQYEQPQSVEVYPRGQTGHSHPETDASQTYQYQPIFNGHIGHVGHATDDTLPLSENYPSKDHTIATVLPLSYKSRVQNPRAVQSVSYVTPMHSAMKYHSQYKVMVPQTVFNRPTESKVSYVNSHSIQNAYLQSSRYNGGQSQYAPAARHRQMHYPWNINSLPKRMVRLQKKSDTETMVPTNDKPTS